MYNTLCTKVVNIRNIPAKLEQRRVCILPGGYRAEPSERRQRQREDQGRDGSADERVINTARGISFDLHLRLRSISLAFSRLSQDHEFRAAINLQKTKNNDYAPYDEIDSCHYFLSIPLLYWLNSYNRVKWKKRGNETSQWDLHLKTKRKGDWGGATDSPRIRCV